jgi:hypothetical protein
MKKLVKALIGILFVIIVTNLHFSIKNSNQIDRNLFSFRNTTFAFSETNPCDDIHFIPNTLLKTVLCPSIMGLLGETHKDCVADPDNHCCDPSRMTDC